MAEVRALTARHDARRKEKALRTTGGGDGGSASGASAPVRKSGRLGMGSRLKEVLSRRKAAMRSAGGDSGEDPSLQAGGQVALDQGPSQDGAFNVAPRGMGTGSWPAQNMGAGAPPLGQFMGPFPQAQGPGGLIIEQNERPRISYGDTGLPLGRHLALSVKEKIWKGEFVYLFSLLQTEPEPVPRPGDPIRDSETMRRRKIDKNWTNWLNSLVIYAPALLQMYPNNNI